MDIDVDFDYTGNADRMLLVMQALETVDLEQLIHVAEIAHTLGPFIDPTKYRDALQRGDMDAITELARALQPAAKVFRDKIKPRATA